MVKCSEVQMKKSKNKKKQKMISQISYNRELTILTKTNAI